jgi:hypothetical protein
MDTANRNDSVWAPEALQGVLDCERRMDHAESTQIKELGLTTLPIRVDIRGIP